MSEAHFTNSHFTLCPDPFAIRFQFSQNEDVPPFQSPHAGTAALSIPPTMHV